MSCGIDNYKVNDIVNNFKLLNYDEKRHLYIEYLVSTY